MYLKNILCNFKPLFPIDYSKKKKIISACFFKLHGGSYKDFNIYINGLKILSKFIKNNLPDFSIRLFIDNSIYSDKNIMDIFQHLINIELVLYECSNYKIDDTYHIGLFGSLVRFFPMFDFPNNDSDVVMITDIDWKSYDNIKKSYINVEAYHILKKIKKKNNIKLFINGRLFHMIENQFLYGNKYIVPYVLSSKIINFSKIDKNILLTYILNIKKTKKRLSNYTVNRVKNNKRYENYIFGIDEYFLNHDLKKYFINEKKMFGCKLKYLITDFIFYNIQHTDDKIYKNFFNFVLKDIDNFTYISDEIAYEFMDKYTYNIVENKSINKLSNIQITIFNRIYMYYLKIYNTKEVEYFNKKFLDVILHEKFIGKVYKFMYIFYNIKMKSYILKEIVLPDKYIKLLKDYKNENNIVDISLAIY